MINLSIILASLSSLTMTYSTIDYEAINQENSINICNSYINSRVCYSFDGSERFTLNNDLETYYLYDNLTQKEIRSWNFNNNFLEYSLENGILLYSTSKDNFYSFDGKNMINLKDNEVLSNLEISTIAEDDIAAGTYQYVKNFEADSTKHITNYEYFVKLGGNHSENITNMSCSIVSFSTLLGYYDTFYHDNMINDVYDNTVTGNFAEDNYLYFRQSPGVDKMFESNRFHDSLCDLFKSINGRDLRTDKVKESQIKNFYSYYLDKWINVDCELNMLCGSLADAITKVNVSRIKNVINEDRPVLVYGSGHSTVAFAYDDKYVYVQGDHNYLQRTVWDSLDDNYTSGIDMLNSFGMADIKIKSPHLHSNNYLNLTTGKHICPCGYKY